MLVRLSSAAGQLVIGDGLRLAAPVMRVACGCRAYQKSARDPRHGGFSNKHAANVGTALEGKASRGDVLKVQLTIEDGVIKDARFKSLGCNSSAASSSAATDMILGRPLEKVEEIASQLPLEAANSKSVMLAKEAIQAAVADYRKKHEAVSCHFKQPRNIGALDRTSPDVGTALVGKASLGGIIKMQVMVEDGLIRDAKFKTCLQWHHHELCQSTIGTIATSSYATEAIIGRTIEQAESLSSAEIASQLKLSPSKLHCSVLAEEAVRAAIADYRAKHQCVQDHFSNPRNVGAFDTKASNVGSHHNNKGGVGPVLVGKMSQ